MAEPQERVSVSRDALRAELAELELRLIEKLASKSEVEMLKSRVEKLEELASPLKEKKILTVNEVEEAISAALQSKEARGWTTRERYIGVLLFMVTIATFAIQLRGLN
jgi:hypothetical protein